MIRTWERHWLDHGDVMGWDFPPATWWQRLPLVRHARAELIARDLSIEPLAYRYWLAAGVACGWNRR